MGWGSLRTILLLFLCFEANFVTVASARKVGDALSLGKTLQDLEVRADELFQAASDSQDKLREKLKGTSLFVNGVTASLVKWALTRSKSLSQCFGTPLSKDERFSISSYVQSTYGFVQPAQISTLLNGTRDSELVKFLTREFESRPDWAQWILDTVSKTQIGHQIIQAVASKSPRHTLEAQVLVQLQGADPASLSTSVLGISDPASLASLPEMLSSVGPPQALSLAEGLSGSSGTFLTTSLGSGYSSLTQSDVLSSFIGPFTGSFSTAGGSSSTAATQTSGTSTGFFADSSSSTSIADIISLVELQVRVRGSPGMGSSESLASFTDSGSLAGGSSPGSTGEDAEVYQSAGKEAGIESSSSTVISMQSSSGSGASQSMNGAQAEAANAAANGGPQGGASSGDSSLSQSSQSSAPGGGCCGALMFVIFFVGMAAAAEYYKSVLHKYDDKEYEQYLKESIDAHIKQLSEYLALHPDKLAAMKTKDAPLIVPDEEDDLDEDGRQAKEPQNKVDVSVLRELPLNFDKFLSSIVPVTPPEDPLENQAEDSTDPKAKARKDRSPGEELKKAQEKMMEAIPKFLGVFYMGFKAVPQIVSKQFAVHLLIIMVALAMSGGNSSSGA